MSNRIAPSLAALAGLLFAIGCAHPAPPRTGAPELTDSARYASALEEARVQYQNEVEMAVAQVYRTRAEADRVAASFDAGRYDYILRQHLAARGLTERGLRSHASRHAETRSLWRTVSDQVAATSFTADLIRDRVRTHPPLMQPLDSPDTTTEVQVAIVSELP